MPEPFSRTTSDPGPSAHALRPRHALVTLCAAVATVGGGLAGAQVVSADPDLTLDEVKERVADLHHEAEVAAERYHRATDELDDLERQLAKAEEKVESQESLLKEMISDVGGFAAASYRAGGMDPTLQILLSDDPDDYLAQASVIDAYANQQAEQLAAVATQRQRLEQDTLLVEEDLARIEALEQELAEEKARADELLAEAEALLDQLEAEERARLEEERRQAEREALAEQESRTEDRSDDGSSGGSGKGQIALDFALAQLGDAYLWGGTGPDAWDCSGLTQAAWAQAGVSLPRSSGAQIGVGTRVSWDQLQPGDLVFFYSPISHVGIYAGNGQMVHAVRPGVPVEVVDLGGYYASNFAGATRPAA